MSERAPTRGERRAALYLERRANRVRMQLAAQETPQGNRTVTRKTEDELWNERDPSVTPEDEARFWAEADELGMPEEMAKAYVGSRLYPFRPRLAGSGERALDPYAAAKYADTMSRKTGWRPDDEMSMPAEGGY